MACEGADNTGLEIRPLSDDCQRGAFSCTHAEINQWFKNTASKEHNRGRSRVWTGHLLGNKHPTGFYSLCTRIEDEADLPRDFQKGLCKSRLFGSKNLYTSVHLEWLAVHSTMEKQGFGSILLAHAIEQFSKIADMSGIQVMTLNPISLSVVVFYETLGFASINGGAMFLPAKLAGVPQTSL